MTSFLSTLATPSWIKELNKWQWSIPTQSGKSELSVRLAERNDSTEPWSSLKRISGNIPFVYIIVYIRGGMSDIEDTRKLVKVLLTRFSGCAFDDYTRMHPWTLAEIEGNSKVNGLVFFDPSGPYEQDKRVESARIAELVTGCDVRDSRHNPYCHAYRLFHSVLFNFGKYPDVHLSLDVANARAICRKYIELLDGSDFKVNPYTPEFMPSLVLFQE